LSKVSQTEKDFFGFVSNEMKARTMEPIYRIRLLGPPQVDKAGAPLPAFRTQKTSALLGYLVRQQQPISRSYLADLLWGDHSETRGRRNLSNELSHLSAHLPGLFEADRQTIHFQPRETYWVDTLAFEKLVRPPSTPPNGGEALKASLHRGELEGGKLAEAATLYRGDFLAGRTLGDCPEFEMWLEGEQEYWRRRIGEVLAGLIEYHAGQGENDQAQAYARRWLALEPWCEEIHRYLMILLARSGQRSAALAQYESCRRILAEELAVEPAVETLALVEQIRRGALKPADGRWGIEAGREAGKMDAKRTGALPSSTLDPQSSAAPLPLLPSDRRNQLILLNKVKNFWVKGVLEQTLRDTPRLELARRPYPEAIEQPWAQVVGPLPHDAQSIPPEKSTFDLFQEADCALLILGAPGVGKTITLIELATELIALAEDDPGRPIPVILNLSSWSKRRPALADWVVEELTAKYQIPRRMGRAWLENNELLLLLDGFDEIAFINQPDCARAINQFREAHGLTGLVVCSRTHAFEAGTFRLRLGGAVMLQPLNIAQIDHYLAASGDELNFLRVGLQQEAEHGSAELREVLQSPLMLSVIRLAYQGIGVPAEHASADAVLPAGAAHDTRGHLFTAYVQRMLQRRGGDGPYPASQTTSWLTWLAQKMFQHHQTIFLLEQLQPAWLPSHGWRWLFLLSCRIIESLGIGVLVWALILFYQIYAPEVASKGPGLVVGLLPFNGGAAVLVGAMLIALGLSGLIAVFDGFYFEWLNRRADLTEGAGLQIGRHFMVAGLAGGLPAIIILAVSPDSLWVALYWGMVSGVGYGILSYLVHGQNFQEAVRAVEKVAWSWSGALKGALLGLIAGGMLQIVGWHLTGAWLSGEMLWGLSFLIAGAVRGRSLEMKHTPNQGIKLSAKNGLFAGFLGGLAGFLMGWLTLDGYNGLRFGLAAFIIWGLIFGGGNVINHFLLRLLLWAFGDMPWNYARFLDYAAERVLLRKVGGGYIFMHRLLQAYFANLVQGHPRIHHEPASQHQQ
jgi:DNA-binding SARP family transcriptional activator